MRKSRWLSFLLTPYWHGWCRWVAWGISIGAIFSLGLLRVATDAEFSFATLALLPVLLIAWLGGRSNGLLIAFLAAAMWAISDGVSARQFSASWIPWANSVTRWMTYSLVAFLTAKVHEQYDKEHENATRDVLTGLLNRRAFLDGGMLEVERLKRYSHPAAFVFIDLDNFKQLNDTQGHDVGDAALQEVAETLRNMLRTTDLVARLGGDEFAVLLPEIGFDAALDTANKILLAAHKALQKFPPVKLSIGLAWYEEINKPFLAMLEDADRLMYAAKENGKGNIRAQRIASQP